MACSVCQKSRKRINGMKKTNLTKTLGDVAAGTAGLVAAQMLNKVSFIGANPMIGGAVKIVGGAILAGSSKGIMQKVAMGVALGGGVDLATNFLTPKVEGIGYLGTRGGSTSVANVAGYGPIVD